MFQLCCLILCLLNKCCTLRIDFLGFVYSVLKLEQKIRSEARGRLPEQKLIFSSSFRCDQIYNNHCMNLVTLCYAAQVGLGCWINAPLWPVCSSSNFWPQFLIQGHILIPALCVIKLNNVGNHPWMAVNCHGKSFITLAQGDKHKYHRILNIKM